jgi:hypothetical protein
MVDVLELEEKCMMHKIYEYINIRVLKNWFLILLLLITILTRIPILYYESIPFTFDHGKDSLAVMDLVLNKRIKFIGPWTSIPGLFFGPAWYYLLAPAFVIFNGEPVGFVWTMLLLVLMEIFLLYKYFGKTPALVFTASSLSWSISISAWNPFPMVLLTIVLLIFLKKLKERNKLKNWQYFVLGLTASLGFHFSTAFAVLYPIFIAVFILRNRIKLQLVQIILLVFGFTLPFLPQLAFEVRHDFIQVKAVAKYIFSPDVSAPKPGLTTVLQSIYSETLLNITPEINIPNFPKISIVSILYASGLLVFIMFYSKAKSPLSNFITFPHEIIYWTLGALGLFSFFHYNSWYLIGLLPLYIISFAQLLDFILHNLKGRMVFYVYLLFALYLLTPITKTYSFFVRDYMVQQNSQSFLPVKKRTLSAIRDEAGQRPFASYHFAAHIYDFDWQYLYFLGALKEYTLPMQFAYQADYGAYTVEKKDLENYFNAKNQNPEIVFFILEVTPGSDDMRKNWFNNQVSSKVYKTWNESNSITVLAGENTGD